MQLNGKSTDVFLKDLMSQCKHAKHQKLSRYSRVGAFLACLFVSASDELIGAETDWLLLREGGNFSVTLWLIIALKYVTVPTPSEVFDRTLWCVFTQAGRQLSDTHSMLSHTSDCLLQTPVWCKLSKKNTVLLQTYSGNWRHNVWENISLANLEICQTIIMQVFRAYIHTRFSCLTQEHN